MIAPAARAVHTESANVLTETENVHETPTGFSHPVSGRPVPTAGMRATPAIRTTRGRRQQRLGRAGGRSAADPTLATTRNPASATLGAGATLRTPRFYRAERAGRTIRRHVGVAPTHGPSTPEPVAGEGNGTYTDPERSLAGGCGGGMYQWDATYSGDEQQHGGR